MILEQLGAQLVRLKAKEREVREARYILQSLTSDLRDLEKEQRRLLLDYKEIETEAQAKFLF